MYFEAAIGLLFDALLLGIWFNFDCKNGHTSTVSECSIFVPKSFRNSASQLGCAGHAGAVTKLPSTTASVTGTSVYLPPARSTSGLQAGYAVQRLPSSTPAAVRTCNP